MGLLNLTEIRQERDVTLAPLDLEICCDIAYRRRLLVAAAWTVAWGSKVVTGGSMISWLPIRATCLVLWAAPTNLWVRGPAEVRRQQRLFSQRSVQLLAIAKRDMDDSTAEEVYKELRELVGGKAWARQWGWAASCCIEPQFKTTVMERSIQYCDLPVNDHRRVIRECLPTLERWVENSRGLDPESELETDWISRSAITFEAFVLGLVLVKLSP